MPSYNELPTNYINGDFIISPFSTFKTLMGCPDVITGDFSCDHTDITSLVGGPQQVGYDYYCTNTHITNLIGCASHIGGTLCFQDSNITSLVGIHKIIKSCNQFVFNPGKITEGGIGLLMIANLNFISKQTEPFKIIKKYLGQGTKGMMECSKELKAKGFESYAKL